MFMKTAEETNIYLIRLFITHHNLCGKKTFETLSVCPNHQMWTITDHCEPTKACCLYIRIHMTLQALLNAINFRINRFKELFRPSRFIVICCKKKIDFFNQLRDFQCLSIKVRINNGALNSNQNLLN